MKTKIKEPFYGAGTKYGWTKDGYHIWGIGIKMTDLLNNKDLELEVRDKTYKIKTLTIKPFVNRYNSFYRAKNDTNLAVFSFSLLELVNNGSEEINSPKNANLKQSVMKLY